jgi:hypothetical protein
MTRILLLVAASWLAVSIVVAPIIGRFMAVGSRLDLFSPCHVCKHRQTCAPYIAPTTDECDQWEAA